MQKIESESYVTLRSLFALLFNGQMYHFLALGLCVFRQNHIMIIDYRNKDKTGRAFVFLSFFFCIKQNEFLCFFSLLFDFPCVDVDQTKQLIKDLIPAIIQYKVANY